MALFENKIVTIAMFVIKMIMMPMIDDGDDINDGDDAC